MFPQNIPRLSHVAVWDHSPVQDSATAQDEGASSASTAVGLGAEEHAQALLQNTNCC